VYYGSRWCVADVSYFYETRTQVTRSSFIKWRWCSSHHWLRTIMPDHTICTNNTNSATTSLDTQRSTKLRLPHTLYPSRCHVSVICLVCIGGFLQTFDNSCILGQRWAVEVSGSEGQKIKGQSHSITKYGRNTVFGVSHWADAYRAALSYNSMTVTVVSWNCRWHSWLAEDYGYKSTCDMKYHFGTWVPWVGWQEGHSACKMSCSSFRKRLSTTANTSCQ